MCAELYEQMRQRPEGACLQKRKCSYHADRPWGWYDRDLEHSDYRLSLSRNSGMPVTFEPQALDDAMRGFLQQTGRCDLHLQTRFVRAETDPLQRTVRAVLATDARGNDLRIEAPVFIDATADIHVAPDAGYEHTIGPEGADVYGEASATADEGVVLNNASPCYRIAPKSEHPPQSDPWRPHDCDVSADDIHRYQHSHLP